MLLEDVSAIEPVPDSVYISLSLHIETTFIILRVMHLCDLYDGVTFAQMDKTGSICTSFKNLLVCLGVTKISK